MNAPFALLCLLIAVALVAYIIATWWAHSDHKTIKGRIASGLARDLNHGELLGWRIVVMLFGFGLAWCVLKWTGSTMLYLLPLAGVAWSIFASQHVWKLNKLRGMDWRYMSPGNVWDRLWIRLSSRGARRMSTHLIVGAHSGAYAYGGVYTKDVHKAGTRAMLFRAVVLLLSVVGYVIILCR